MRSRWLHPITQRSPPSVSLAGFIIPGGYLLSRDLSSDYHRRADVSLPGSEWDRVGPSGYDHQVAGKCCFLLVPFTVYPVGHVAAFCIVA